MVKQDDISIFLYKVIRYGLIFAVTLIYVNCFKWVNPLFGAVMAILFAYSFSSLASMIIPFFVYYLDRPKLLPERKDILGTGIPKDANIVFFRPTFVKSNPEMDTHIDNMRQDMLTSLEPLANMRFMIVDNTRDTNVREYTRQRIKKLQDEFGSDRVFYMHRNVKCDFFKKVGIYEDAIMLLYEGWTRPKHYISEKWQPFTKGLRNPTEPLWDEIIGDISVLGVNGSVDDILKGRDVSIDPAKRINISIVQDADNVWPKGAIRKLVSKMLHPDNKDYVIYQPSIDISNPDDNTFIKMTFIGREMYGFDPIAKWRIFNFSPFYGKGAMNVELYVKEIIKAEVLHPAKAASHDFQEALHAWSVLLEDVYIWERTFSNKLAELTRTALWGWGDLETVRQYLLKPFEAGRKSHLFVLLRNVAGVLMYDIWVLLSILGFAVSTLCTVENPGLLISLFLVIILVNVILPKFISPVAGKYYKKPYDLPLPLLKQKSIMEIFLVACIETLISVLIHSLDLVYKPIGFIKNFRSQLTNKPYVWKTGAMSEIETQGATLLTNYRVLRLSTIIGVLLLAMSFAGIYPAYVGLFLSPYTASFLLGPYAIWLTAKNIKK